MRVARLSAELGGRRGELLLLLLITQLLLLLLFVCCGCEGSILEKFDLFFEHFAADVAQTLPKRGQSARPTLDLKVGRFFVLLLRGGHHGV